VSLQISTRKSGEITILELRGRSTIEGESELLSRCLKRLIANGAFKLLLKLSGLSQLDSSGVGVIIDTFVSVRNQGGELKLLCPRGRVLEVLRVLRLTEVIPCFDDENDALASFQPAGVRSSP
jgi:anti-anti-sigma factor